MALAGLPHMDPMASVPLRGDAVPGDAAGKGSARVFVPAAIPAPPFTVLTAPMVGTIIGPLIPMMLAAGDLSGE
jgi:hypothetical protein